MDTAMDFSSDAEQLRALADELAALRSALDDLHNDVRLTHAMLDEILCHMKAPVSPR